ncbi:hypothetical protein Daus18300_001417 [Diaporthe australafricana]|uniref:Clr5 domain-containing protein n=1 Tax=Diaporthe australafricana TaxID=127596 RepID=A0ABR3XWZ8_9PEZI
MTAQKPIVESQYPKRARGFSSEAEWADHQPLIKKLYVDEGRTLQDVMEIMKRDHNFNASTKMFKTRIKTWGYRKNIRLRHGEDKSLIQVLHNSVQYSGYSETPIRSFRLRNGQIISQDRLATYLRRRGEGRARANQPVTIRAVRPPDSLYISEAVLFQVRAYIHGGWEETISTAEQLDTLREERASSGEWNSLAHGVRCALEQKRLNDALVLMRRAPEVLTTLIERQPINMLQVLFMSLAYFTLDGFLERPETEQLLIVVKCLFKYAATFVVKNGGLPSSHPLRQMLVTLTNADEHDLHQLATKSWRVNCLSWDGLMDRPRSTYAIAS